MQKKILSISIAAYNIERFLPETVASLTRASDCLERMEILIVNDGSTDRTSELAHGLQRQFPESIVVLDKENGGYGSTINASLAVARGKYYKLLDGDDCYLTEALNGFLDFLEKTDCDLIVTPYEETYVGSGQIRRIDTHTELPECGNKINKLKIDNLNYVMDELAIKTEVLRRAHRPIAENCFYTDNEFAFYCLCASETVARYPESIYRHHLGIEGQSVSLAGMRRHYGELPIVAQRMMQCYTEVVRDVPEGKKAILDYAVRNITFQTFRVYMLLEKPARYRKELKSFDCRMKEQYPEAYALGNESKFVHTLRKLDFRFYTVFSLFAQKKYR